MRITAKIVAKGKPIPCSIPATPPRYDRRAGGIQTRRVGRGEEQPGNALRVAEAVGRNASQVREDVIERHCWQTSWRVRSGATNVPRITSAPSESVYRSVRCALNK